MKRIILVGCCAQKLSSVAIARDMYRSQLFQKSAQWAEKQDCEWFILSAKHGIIKPHGYIAPYNMTLGKMSAYERSKWGEYVAEDIKQLIRYWGVDTLTIDIMAGKSYAEWVNQLDERFTVRQPMAGMQIGQRLNWLNNQRALKGLE